jgi:NYN domain
LIRARIFVDFWNFQLGWNDAHGRNMCDWTKLPAALIAATAATLSGVGLSDTLSLEETIVHASVEVGDGKQRGWFTNFLDRQPSYDVKLRERRVRPRKLRCRSCGTETTHCPSCAEQFRSAGEKGVDTALVTDLLSLAWQGAYDLAILVTSDADFIPAVEHVQEKGLKVINAAWPGIGHELRTACWAGFEITSFSPSLFRPV